MVLQFQPEMPERYDLRSRPLDESSVPPLPMQPQTTVVWHYTSADGLWGIARNHEVWATSPSALNDTSEMEYGADVIRAAWDELRGQLPSSPGTNFIEDTQKDELAAVVRARVYVVSASKEPDLLSQWVHYAHTDGFAIGLHTNGYWHMRGENGQPIEAPYGDRGERGWYDVIYEPEEQLTIATEVIRWVVAAVDRRDAKPMPRTLSVEEEDPRIALRTLLLQLKHPGFKDEREVRLVIPKAEGAAEDYRVSRDRLIPFIRVGQHPWVEGVPKSLNIKGVVLGPSVASGSLNTVRNFLRTCDYGVVPLAQSEIPYRR